MNKIYEERIWTFEQHRSFPNHTLSRCAGQMWKEWNKPPWNKKNKQTSKTSFAPFPVHYQRLNVSSVVDVIRCRVVVDYREVSRLCSGLPGVGERIVLAISLCWWKPLLSDALLFWLGDKTGGSGEGVLFRLVGASSSGSVSSMRGMDGSESSIRNSGWLMKLWMELRDSGVSRPS